MPEVSVPWGSETLTFSLPGNWSVEQATREAVRPAATNWAERLARAVAQPGTGPSLADLLRARRQGRITLIVEDITRHSPLPQIIEVILREIHHAGIADEQVEIVIATGMHPAMDPEQARAKLGPVADDLPWRCNPWSDPKAYVRVGHHDGIDAMIDRGVATADLRVILSSVSPHLQAGFGGGYKMLVHGCASLETVRAVHRRGIGRGFRQLVGLEGAKNPMRKAIDAVGQLVDGYHGRTFAVQYLLDDAGLPSYLAAGEVLAAQQMLAKQCAVSCGLLVPQSADVVIANAHPRDHDLWQCFKSIPNTLWAARPNGVLICLARCPAGTGGMKFPRLAIRSSWVRKVLGVIGPGGLGSLLTRLVPSLAGDAAFFVQLALRALHRNPILMVSPELHAAGVRFPGLDLYATVDEAIAVADQLLGAGPQKVTVFPAGGTTYPVPPAAASRGGRR